MGGEWTLYRRESVSSTRWVGPTGGFNSASAGNWAPQPLHDRAVSANWASDLNIILLRRLSLFTWSHNFYDSRLKFCKHILAPQFVLQVCPFHSDMIALISAVFAWVHNLQWSSDLRCVLSFTALTQNCGPLSPPFFWWVILRYLGIACTRITWDGRMIHARWIENDLEGSGPNLIEEL